MRKIFPRPIIVLATPPGQLHELGAIIVGAAARSHGWRTTYLGAALPVEELAGALRNLEPRAVGLSIVYPPDDAAMRRDLVKLAGLLPNDCALIIGGRSASAYSDTARKIKAIEVGGPGGSISGARFPAALGTRRREAAFEIALRGAVLRVTELHGLGNSEPAHRHESFASALRRGCGPRAHRTHGRGRIRRCPAHARPGFRRTHLRGSDCDPE